MHLAPEVRRSFTKRVDRREIERLHKAIVESGYVKLADTLPTVMIIFNCTRQVVYANAAAVDLVGRKSVASVLGLRLGEMFRCIHMEDAFDGCGSSHFCAKCGGGDVIASGIDHQAKANQCRMLRHTLDGVQGLTLDVRSEPFELEGEELTVFSATDISADIRRRAMERLFFHDVLNLAGGLHGVMDGFADEFREVNPDLVDVMGSTVRFLYEEIRAQKTLAAAESRELKLRPESVDTKDLLDSLVGLYSRHNAARTVKIRCADDADRISMVTDRTLVTRVLGNLIKNALEATSATGQVTAGCDRLSDGVSFWVHNPSVMSEEVQLQIFNRSFSTKGEGRGLGAYSIMLFTETFLKGHVSFVSTPEEGTTFTVVLPLNLVCRGA